MGAIGDSYGGRQWQTGTVMRRSSAAFAVIVISLLSVALSETGGWVQPADAKPRESLATDCESAPAWSVDGWEWLESLHHPNLQEALQDLGTAVQEHPLTVGHVLDAANERVLVGMDPSSTDKDLKKARKKLHKAAHRRIPIETQRACFARETMTAVAAEVSGRSTWIADYEGPLAAMDYVPDPATGRVRIRLPLGDVASNSTARMLSDHFGDRVDLQLVEAREIISPLAGSRLADVSPHFGGARAQVLPATLPPDYSLTCTLGFTVVRNGVRYMATAGHCGAVDTLWATPTAGVFGRTALRPGYGAYDVALIAPFVLVDTGTPQFADDLWQDPDPIVGNPDPSQLQLSRDVVGTRAVDIGTAVCTGGSMTHAQCGWITYTLNGGYCDEIPVPPFQHCFSQMARAYSLTAAVIGGDSGGPVYGRTSVSSVDIRGLISGGAVIQNPDDLRYSIVAFHPAAVVEAASGSTVATCC